MTEKPENTEPAAFEAVAENVVELRPKSGKGAKAKPAEAAEQPLADTGLTGALADILARTVLEPGTPFVPDVLAALGQLRARDRARYETLRPALRAAGCAITALEKELAKKAAEASRTEGRRPDGILAPVEPWPEPVDGAAVLDAIAAAVRRHVCTPPGVPELVALWVLHAHAHNAADTSPILAIQSPQKRCGKTTLLNLVAEVVPKRLPTANVTAAAMFRAVEKFSPTLLIDEADTFLRDNDELRGVLNSGFSRLSAFVVRTVGDDHEPRPFATWAPKAIASINELPETLQDRAIIAALRRRLPGEHVERLDSTARAAFPPLRAKAARFAHDELERLTEADPALPDGLNDRAADCWRPLLAIADAAGGHWPETARRVALELSGDGGGATDLSNSTQLLENIRTIFEDTTLARISSTDLAHRLAENENWPWGEWRNGQPITPRGVARMLAPFGVRPAKDRQSNGYSREQFADAWQRYVSPFFPDTPATSSTTSTDDDIGF